MPKKIKKDLIAQRIIEVAKDNGIAKQIDIASKCGISAMNMNRILSVPPESRTLENMLKIAKTFNVSLDYLLGLSDVKTTNIDINTIVSKTGLKEETANILLGLLESNTEFKEVLEYLLNYSSLNKTLIVILDLYNLLTSDFYSEIPLYSDDYIEMPISGDTKTYKKLPKDINMMFGYSVIQDLLEIKEKSQKKIEYIKELISLNQLIVEQCNENDHTEEIKEESEFAILQLEKTLKELESYIKGMNSINRELYRGKYVKED